MPDKLVIDEPYKNSCQKAEQVHHDVRMTGRSYKYQKRQAATQRSSEKVLSWIVIYFWYILYQDVNKAAIDRFNPAWYKPMQWCADGIPMGILCQVVYIDTIDLAVIG